MQRHHPGAPAFAGADGEHPLGQVDVAAGQGQRFADPQAGARISPGKTTQQCRRNPPAGARPVAACSRFQRAVSDLDTLQLGHVPEPPERAEQGDAERGVETVAMPPPVRVSAAQAGRSAPTKLG